jgi:cell division protein FtsB
MEPASVNAARVRAWIQEGQELLERVLPVVLDEREALQRERDEAIRRAHDLQAENDALRAEVAQATAALRQLEQGQAEIAGSVGQFVTQMTRALEPMRILGEKLGPVGYGRAGG